MAVSSLSDPVFAAAKHYTDAEKYLEAGWRLNDSLKSRPELDLQLQAIHMDQKAVETRAA